MNETDEPKVKMSINYENLDMKKRMRKKQLPKVLYIKRRNVG